MPDDDHDHQIAELDDLIRTVTSSIETMQADTYEKIATVADEVEKLQEMVRGLGRMIRQEVVPLLPRPKVARPLVYDDDDGDLVGHQ
jgi:hypothetical protein